MKQVRRLKDILTETIQAEHGQTSSNPDDSVVQTVIKCFDPEHSEYPCPICGGLGVIKYDVPVEHPRFGKLFRCPNNAVEKDTSHHERLREMSNLKAYRSKTFETFEVQHDKSLENIRDRAIAYADNLDGWIVFEGAYGCGKTHLAASIGNEALKRGVNVLFLTTPDLLDHLRATYNPTAEVKYDELFERVKSVDLLILDDLGVENPSAWAKEKLFQVLNHRHARRLATVITTNVNIDTLDPRLGSRLQDTSMVDLMSISAVDYRTKYKPGDGDDLQLSGKNLNMYQNMTIATFDTSIAMNAKEQQNLQNLMQKGEDFINNGLKFSQANYKRTNLKTWLLITGGFHSGKTHFAAAMATELHRMVGEKEVKFVAVPDLLDYLRTTFSPDSKISFSSSFLLVQNARFLILDDLNTESASPWAKEKLFQLLEYRYIYGSPTLITTSQKFDDIEPRLQHRFADTRICTVFGLEVSSFSQRMKIIQSR